MHIVARCRGQQTGAYTLGRHRKYRQDSSNRRPSALPQSEQVTVIVLDTLSTHSPLSHSIQLSLHSRA